MLDVSLTEMLKDFFSTSRGYGAEKLTKASSGLLMFLFIMVVLLTGYKGQLLIGLRGPVELDVKHQTQVNMGQIWTSRSKWAALRVRAHLERCSKCGPEDSS